MTTGRRVTLRCHSEMPRTSHCFGQRDVRCSLLRPSPTQRARLEEIRDNLQARIAEAIREGWLGEVEGLHVSLAGANDKLQQIDSTRQRQAAVTQLGLPTFTRIAGRTSPEPSQR
jgi:hypothetical protein